MKLNFRPHLPSLPQFDLRGKLKLEFLRAFPQAPWRTQTQAMAAWSITLLIVAVMGGLYLVVAARAGTAGRDLQLAEARKAELILSNNELRAQLAELRAVTRMAGRARELGFTMALPEQIEYLAVPNYPHSPHTASVAATTPTPSAAAPLTLSEWLTVTFNRLLTGQGGG
jgi:hypothetical protein